MKLIRFGVYGISILTLPVLEKSHDQGSGASRMLFVDTPDGQFDLLATERARRAPFSLPVACKLYGTTPTAVQTQLDTLKAKRGERDKLWAETPAGDLRWVTARLDSVVGTNLTKTSCYLPVTLTFTVLPQYWNGTDHSGWNLDEGEYLDAGLYLDSEFTFALDASPKTVSVTNSGNVNVEDCIITVTAQTSVITALVIERIVNSVSVDKLTYNGGIAAGKSLVIKSGRGSIENDGLGDYANLTLGGKNDNWFSLAPGANSIKVTKTGGGATSSVDFTFSDAWA